MVTGVSGDRMVDYLLYGIPSQKTRNYFQNELNNLTTTLTPNHWAVENFNNLYNHFYSQKAIEEAQTVLSQSAYQFRDDVIHQVTYDNYQPNLVTQRYIMACPEVWEMRMKGLSNDFNMSYRDIEPNVKDLTWRSDYIDVMDGMLQFDQGGYGFIQHWVREETNRLSDRERMVILNNWDVVRSIIANDEDPTVV